MTRRAAVIWLIPGLTISVIDCWLSIQSMFGIVNPTNAIGVTVAAGIGFGLTAFAVLAPIARGNSVGLLALWWILVVIDVGTSVLGAIWYGLLHHGLHSRIVLSGLRFDPTNWLATAVFVGFVLLVAWCCAQLGRALKALMG